MIPPLRQLHGLIHANFPLPLIQATYFKYSIITIICTTVTSLCCISICNDVFCMVCKNTKCPYEQTYVPEGSALTQPENGII